MIMIFSWGSFCSWVWRRSSCKHLSLQEHFSSSLTIGSQSSFRIHFQNGFYNLPMRILLHPCWIRPIFMSSNDSLFVPFRIFASWQARILYKAYRSISLPTLILAFLFSPSFPFFPSPNFPKTPTPSKTCDASSTDHTSANFPQPLFSSPYALSYYLL